MGIVSSVRLCLLLAAVACVLRPTNLLVWMLLSAFLLLGARSTQSIIFARESALCG